MSSTLRKTITGANRFRQAERSSQKAAEEKIFTKTLIASATAAVFAGMMGVSGSAMAAGDGTDGAVGLDGSTSIVADQPTGLLESGATGTQTDTIDVNGTTDLALGTEGSANSDSITISGGSAALVQTINVIDSTAGTDTFTMAGDIELANGTDTLNLNIVTDGLDAALTGDVMAADGDTVAITLGDAAGGTNTLTVTAASAQDLDIDATIDSAAAGDTSNLTITAAAVAAANNVTFSKDIGSSVALDTITIGDGTTVSNVTFEGSVSAGSIVFSGTTDDVVTIGGSSNQTITGPITAAGTGLGSISVSNTGGTVTFASALGMNGGNLLGALTLNADSTTVFNSTVDVTGVTINDGAAVTFDGAANTVGLTLGTSATDSMTIGVGSGFDDGDTVITVGATGIAENSDNVSIQMSSQGIGDAESLTIIDNITAATPLTLSKYDPIDTALFDYTLNIDTANTLAITADARSTSEVASALGIESQEASSLMNAYQALRDDTNTANTTANADIVAVLDDALNTAGAGGSNSDAKKLAQQVGVQADTMGAVTSAAVSASHQVVGMSGMRLASLRSGEQYAGGQMGLASGDDFAAKSFWLRPFGGWADQDKRGGVEGYDSDTYGVALGMDTAISPTTRVGASFAYANTDVDGDGAGNAQADIDGYHFTVYGDYTIEDYYLQGMFSYARGNNETSEQVSTVTRKADYDSDQFTFSVGGGKPIALQSGAFLTPMADLTWTRVSSDNYTTTGASGLNMNVNPDDTNAVVASLGAQYHTVIEKDKGKLIPTAYAGINYDFAGDEAQVSSNFTGGGASWVTKGADVAQFGGKIGLGLTYDKGLFSVGANYGLDFKSDYTNHAAMIEARWKF